MLFRSTFSVCDKGFGENCSSAVKVRYWVPDSFKKEESGTQGTKVLACTGSVYIFRIHKLEIQTKKGAGSRNRKQTCYLYSLYCCPHVAIVFCIAFCGWDESTTKLLPKIHQYLCNRTTCECFVCFSTKLKGPSSK